MSVLVGKKTRVLTQGITGSTGQLHTRLCREYGTPAVVGTGNAVATNGVAFEEVLTITKKA